MTEKGTFHFPDKKKKNCVMTSNKGLFRPLKYANLKYRNNEPRKKAQHNKIENVADSD